jgi:CubicO group peptidase (beta-lactamase class C family)
MNPFEQRRLLLAGSLCAIVGTGARAAGSGVPAADPGPVAQSNVAAAVAQLDRLAAHGMARTGVPGLAIAVVQGQKTIYAKGFGVREAGTDTPVDADTVFQLASVSKSLGASVVAREVGLRHVAWNTPIISQLPWFKLSDAHATTVVTIGDLYAHRAGLPEHIGDRLEDMGYSQTAVLEHLRYVALDGFRRKYDYTNFGLTAGGVAVAKAAGTDWATLSEQAIYAPLGMTRTSSRFGDFIARSNRVKGHRKINGTWQLSPVRMPDAQAPAASVTSSVNDMARWLAMMLGKGAYAGKRVVDAAALAPAVSPQIVSSPAREGRAAGHYGFGFNVGITASGRATYGHSGAFAEGTGTAFKVLPSAGIAIVALTNGWPIGVPEIINAQFTDLLEYGAIQHDYAALFAPSFVPITAPEGSLVGKRRPATHAPPSRALPAYAGAYQNDFYGPAVVSAGAESLLLSIGPTPLRSPLTHWDADVFTFTLDNENATPGTISKATFAPGKLLLEYYDLDHMGMFLL